MAEVKFTEDAVTRKRSCDSDDETTDGKKTKSSCKMSWLGGRYEKDESKLIHSNDLNFVDEYSITESEKSTEALVPIVLEALSAIFSGDDLSTDKWFVAPKKSGYVQPSLSEKMPCYQLLKHIWEPVCSFIAERIGVESSRVVIDDVLIASLRAICVILGGVPAGLHDIFNDWEFDKSHVEIPQSEFCCYVLAVLNLVSEPYESLVAHLAKEKIEVKKLTSFKEAHKDIAYHNLELVAGIDLIVPESKVCTSSVLRFLARMDALGMRHCTISVGGKEFLFSIPFGLHTMSDLEIRSSDWKEDCIVPLRDIAVNGGHSDAREITFDNGRFWAPEHSYVDPFSWVGVNPPKDTLKNVSDGSVDAYHFMYCSN